MEVKPVNMLNILVGCLLVSWTSATLFFETPCPDVTPVKNFDFSGYANGTWYEVARYPNDWEGRGDCASIEFKPEAGKTKFQIVDVTDRNNVYSNGYIRLSSNANNSGMVIYESEIYEAPEGEETLPVYVLSVDYKKYMISYECSYNKNTKTRHDYAWVASRTKKLDPQTQNIVDSFLKTSVIDTNKLVWDHFTSEACSVKS